MVKFSSLFFLFEFISIPLGKVKGLSALNLDGNPLDHPPFKIVKQGIKAIQQYLRDEKIPCENDDDDDGDDDNEEQQADLTADVWASSDDEHDGQQRKLRSPHPTIILTRPSLIFLRKSKYKKKLYPPLFLFSGEIIL